MSLYLLILAFVKTIFITELIFYELRVLSSKTKHTSIEEMNSIHTAKIFISFMDAEILNYVIMYIIMFLTYMILTFILGYIMRYFSPNILILLFIIYLLYNK